MELRIILKDPADGDPLDMVIPGVWSDCATIGWKLRYNGEDYGEHIRIERGAGYETFEEAVLLMLKSAFDALNELEPARDKEGE